MAAQAIKDKAAGYLRLTLPLMAKHSIPVTPANSTVWFEFVSGANQPLHKAINDLLSSSQKVDEQVIQDLDQRFVISALEKRLGKTREALRILLDDMGDSVADSDTNMGKYQESLAGHSDKLQGEVTTGELRDVLQKLTAETSAVRASGSQLQEKLEANRLEAEALRKELEEARIKATTDALTGLANRKALMRGLEQMSVAANKGGELCMLLGDIDKFKHVNDTYGHLLGDKVIRFIGNIMQNCVKGKDLVARYGGEEFVILLPNTPYEGALAVAESIRKAIENGRLVRSDTRESIGTVTVSLGVAGWQKGDIFKDLIGRAGAGLYQSKSADRNRVTGERVLAPETSIVAQAAHQDIEPDAPIVRAATA